MFSYRSVAFLSLSTLAGGFASTVQPLGIPFKSPVAVAPGFAASVIFSNLTTPRGITFDNKQNLLVVERGFGVTAFNSVTSGWERNVVIQNAGFTQGIQVDGDKLYVSTATNTFVYKYDAVSKSVASNVSPFSIVNGIPGDGELTTHTLQLEKDASGKTVALLVASGPFTNIDVTARDPASGRSQIRRFVLPPIHFALPPPTPLQWSTGQILAFGIRNPAGFAFPPTQPHPLGSKSLLVVENGASIDGLSNFTAAFVNDNPADELEFVTYPTTPAAITSTTPKTYGFPDCTTLWNPLADPVGNPGFVNKPRGYQFSLELDPAKDDAFCQQIANNHPPALSFQAHSVPLDIKFYTPSGITSKAIPLSLRGHAFVSFHGSFNRSPPTGYGVVQFPYPPHQTSNTLGYTFLIQATNLSTCPGTCIRPVGLAFGNDGRLYVSSDSSGELFVIEKA
ncbi:soluble quino protein glucose dehydrogenase [Pholiota conissans]|uniref:Soluble quino protein glucose dehydrogenase n=1 Tax=Pholiota conissans TaxID=109636 RepID=A0A9P5YN40_9AGAR|nr:soluble quino protein glucose dehydrogenase [Pholiota conissans]